MMNIVRLHSVHNKKSTRVPILVTHDQINGVVSLPLELTYKSNQETWYDYCQRLWMGVYKANGRDTIKLTVHLKLSEGDKLVYELKKWAYYAKMVDNGALTELAEERVKNLELHGIRFKFDIPE